MNMTAVLNSKSAQVAVLALVGAVVAYVVVKRLGDAADKSLDEFNAGTAYDSSGQGTAASAVSALGNATNRASGGLLERFGGWISETFFDPNAGYDPNAPVARSSPKYVPRKAAVRSTQ